MSGYWPALGAVLIAGVFVPLRADPLRPDTHVVEIRGMAFHPEVLRVQQGDTIVWINQDVVPHTATAIGASGWSTGTLTQGQSARQLADGRGARQYFCELHPTMKGTLLVTGLTVRP